MLFLLNTLWFIRTLKLVLFWLYLWQLKEYHVGRFIDHFRTEKGKKLVFNYLLLSKIILVFLFIFVEKLFPLWFSILFLIYLAESLIFIKVIILKNAKKPKPTFKIIFLTLISFAIVILFLWWTLKFKDILQLIWILIFDILTP